MNNSVESYLRQVKKALKTEPMIKDKIISDLRSDIDNLIENGLTVEQAINKIGKPKELAADFNQNYIEYQNIKKSKTAKTLSAVLAAIAVVCLAAGTIGKTVYMQSSHFSYIGGTDGPTSIYVKTEPLTAFVLFDWLVKFAVVAFVVAAILFAGYIILNCKTKGEHK